MLKVHSLNISTQNRQCTLFYPSMVVTTDVAGAATRWRLLRSHLSTPGGEVPFALHCIDTYVIVGFASHVWQLSLLIGIKFKHGTMFHG